MPGREDDARAAIDQAFEYGAQAGAETVHVMAGKTSGEIARRTFIENLRYASDRGKDAGMSVVIEPINTLDVPGYFLSTLDEAAAIIAETGCDNVRILFDCYHVSRMGGDLLAGVQRHLANIGHIQFAAVPDRGEPDRGVIDYATVLPALAAAGYTGYFGAEYKPRATTDAGLG